MQTTIDEMICSFTREEFREFKYFLDRQRNHVHDREDIRLVNLIREGRQEQGASAGTRSRIKKQLELFAAIENTKFESSSMIQGKIEMAKYLFRKNLYNHGWDYLIRAENMAIEQEEYELLNHIYYIQIMYSYNIAVPPPKAFSVTSLLEKRSRNISSAQLDGNANAAYAQLIHELRGFTQRLHIDIDKLVKDILSQYALDDNTIHHSNLRIYYKIVNIVCRALREKRDYDALMKYSINSYELIIKQEKEDAENQSPEYMMTLLDMICIGALRSRHYKNYEKFQLLYAEEARKRLASPGEFSYYDFIPAIDAADLYMCTDRLEMARESLLKVKKKYEKYTGSVRIFFLLRINLIAMHFKRLEYKKCLILYNEIMSMGEKKILTERGFRLDLIILTCIYGAIFHYEEDDADYALYLLTKFKRRYSELLKSEESKRENAFIRILEKIFTQADYLKSKTFEKECKSFIAMKKFDPGDNEYISLNAWLESKRTGVTYYSIFLELVK